MASIGLCIGSLSSSKSGMSKSGSILRTYPSYLLALSMTGFCSATILSTVAMTERGGSVNLGSTASSNDMSLSRTMTTYPLILAKVEAAVPRQMSTAATDVMMAVTTAESHGGMPATAIATAATAEAAAETKMAWHCASSALAVASIVAPFSLALVTILEHEKPSNCALSASACIVTSVAACAVATAVFCFCFSTKSPGGGLPEGGGGDGGGDGGGTRALLSTHW
mmetsp:Transcript_9489/g.20751  ORF Transcript_9489/g.20751 Transcript_9489/m.20751 type:complete len:225 (+) Transcript_9489:1299-1973(+)